jgi:hypothetical protein
MVDLFRATPDASYFSNSSVVGNPESVRQIQSEKSASGRYCVSVTSSPQPAAFGYSLHDGAAS